MSKELYQSSEVLDVKTLSPQTRMRMVLEVFDLGKDKEKNKIRKERFIELVTKYHQEVVKKKANIISDEHRTKLHNQILDILRNMSLSREVSEDKRKLFELLANNRDDVEIMITSYFLGYNTSDPQNYSELKMARRGEGLFTSPPGKEDD